MRILGEWIHRLWRTLLPGRRDSDLEQELQLHLDIGPEDARHRGLNAADSARATRISAGGASQAMDALRDQRRLPWLDDLTRDLRHGWRTLGRTPVFTAIALLTLALGIGANTAIFTIVHGVLLRPLTYPKPEQLLYLTAEFPALALDLGGPAGLSRSLSVMLRALAPLDPATYVAVASLLAAVSALASCVRARRAAMVDPMAAIRRE